MNHWTDRSVLRFWSEKEVRLEAAHLLDQVEVVLKQESQQITPFLSSSMREWFEDVLRKEGLSFKVECGFSEGERARIVVGSNSQRLDAEDAGILLLWVCAKDRRIELEHRQILGSLMGLGFKREVFGDIKAGQGGYYLAVASEITPYLLDHWNHAGREKIEVSLFNDKPDVRSDIGEERHIVLSTLRIDALISKGFGVSRSIAQELLTHGKVRRGGLILCKAETEVRPGDKISVQGFGRIKLISSSQNRKERNACQIEIFKSHQH